MKRVLSGIKPTGEVTLGNYLGAMKRWSQTQDNTQNFYFVPDLHALNLRLHPEQLKTLTLQAVAWLLALGVDPKKSAIFLQSQIPAHAELGIILENYVTFGELSRMTQFKDKVARGGAEGVIGGLFTYPVLMAADILLYDADEIPVGDDQRQHVELTRDIAARFNNLYGPTFKMPVPSVQKVAARVMDLQDPTKKMSKSDAETKGIILLTDSMKVIEQKIMQAVTDSGSTIELSDSKPAITNLLQIYAVLSGKSLDIIQRTYIGRGYGEFKKDLAALAVDVIQPLQTNYQDYLSSKDELWNVLERGRARAGEIAEQKLLEVKSKVGLL